MKFNSSKNTNIESIYDKNNKKRKIIILGLIIFFMILLVSTYITYAYILKDNGKVKDEFFTYITQNDLSFFKANEVYSKIREKMINSDYHTSADIKLSTTMDNNMFSELDLSKFEVNYNVTKNSNRNSYYHSIFTKYAGNDLLAFDSISNNEQFAIKSDEIVNRYVGITKNNFQKTVNNLEEKPVDLSSIKKLKNFVLDREVIDFDRLSQISSLNKYANILKNNISLGTFSKKENIAVTIDSEQIPVTEYMVELDSQKTSELFQQLSNQLENDNDLLAELLVSNVIDFENDQNTILEYQDNDNTVEISGKENNFNTYMNWGENTQESNDTEHVIETEGNSVNDTNTVENNTREVNTVNIYTNTQTTDENTNTIQNQINVQEQTNEQEQITTQEIQINQEAEEQPEQEQPNQIEETRNTVIEEEENLRKQGFITVNEESEGIKEEENNFIIGENYEDTVINIMNFAEKLDWTSYLLTGAKANCTQEELVQQVQKILNDRIKQNSSLIIKMYVNNEENIKTTLLIPETSESFDIQINSKGDHEKYLDIAILKGKENSTNGYTFNLYQKNSDADIKTKINVNKISKNKINEKSTINIETKGTINSKKYTTDVNLSYSDSDGEFKTEVSNILNFDVIADDKELNDDNCLFIDTISTEELLLTRDAIKEKILEVLKEKNKNLNIIDINNSNSIVEQIEQNEITENTQAKEEIKKVLIQTISNKMGEYLNNGTQLKIEDLEGLEIPGYEVDISISSNLAIITVNGYRFKLDSDFNLSDS